MIVVKLYLWLTYHLVFVFMCWWYEYHNKKSSAYADCCNVSQAKKNDCDLLLSIGLVNITYLYIYICFMTF